jgi:hypothetical protein
MKCPKCNYVSHDYLDTCRKCGIDLVVFKQDVGLLVLQPGVLDMSFVLGGAGTDDLFENVDEEVTMHASDDDDFDISLDDYTEHPAIRRAPAGAPRVGGRETEADRSGMDHLTLELDASDLSAEVTARLRAAQVIPAAPSTPATPAAPSPASPGAPTLPGHVTVDMETESISTTLPPGLFQETASVAPLPPQNRPETTGVEDITRSLDFDVSHIDLGLMTSSTDAPGGANIDQARSESSDEVANVADSSGTLASLPLQDVVLADETPAAQEESASERVDPTLPTIELIEVETTFAHIDAERRAASEGVEEATSPVANSMELSVDDSALAMDADEASGSDMPEVVEPAFMTLDEPHLEDISLPHFFEFELGTLAEAETTLSDPAGTTLDEAPLTFADEDVPRTPPSREAMPTATGLTPDDVLTSSDMFALEDLEASTPPEHVTLELSVPALSADPPPGDAPETAEASLSTNVDPGLPTPEALPAEDLDDDAFSGHLTLELDSSEITSDISSITLDNPQREDLPGDVKSKMSPPDDQGDDEEELLLDLDDLEFEDDEPM